MLQAGPIYVMVDSRDASNEPRDSERYKTSSRQTGCPPFKAWPNDRRLCLPCLVNRSCTPCRALLEDHLIPPLGDIDRIDEATGLDAEAGPWSTSWRLRGPFGVDVLASVELEGGLGAEEVNVQRRAVMREPGQFPEWAFPCIQGDIG